MLTIDTVAGNQFDRVRSGVARFNRILGDRLGVPVVGVDDHLIAVSACPLLSIKFGELRPGEEPALLEQLSRRGREAPYRLFVHDVTGLAIEQDLVCRAERVYAGNGEVGARLEPLNSRIEILWSPATILDNRRFDAASISVFSFGMAHKMQTDMFERLRDLLAATGQTYALFVSNANHESVTLEQAALVYDDMHAVFPGVYFLGNLSDVAVSNYIAGTTFFAAFFPRGARANNSTVVAAMERAAVVITNLDDYSPPYLRHMETVIDVSRTELLPTDSTVLDRIGAAASQEARGLSWDRFVERLSDS
ncbi:MAG: hypothetical protein WKF96_13085 [Solirubrobacteraceae bacterium]